MIGINGLDNSKNKKILLVEDSRLTKTLVTNLLQDYGYEVETASESEEAIRKACQTFLPNLILMDIELKGNVDGIETAKKIIKLRDVPVVFLTANTSSEIINKIKNIKAYGYIVKGTDKQAMISTIEMAIKLHETYSIMNMFNYIFENSTNELYIFDPDTLKFIKVSKTAIHNLGYTEEELKSLTPICINPEFNEQSFKEFISPLTNEKLSKIVYKSVHRRKDSSTYPAEVHLELFDYIGKKLCFAVATNIAVEESLKEKELLLKAITKSTYDAVIIINSEGKIVFWNPSSERIFGYSKQEVKNYNIHFLLATNSNTALSAKEMLAHFKKTGKLEGMPNPIELKAKHKNGHEIDIELSLSTLEMINERYIVGIIRDINERKKAEREINKTWELYFELAENAPIGILRCDKEGNILYVNNKALEILGSPSKTETKKINLLTFPLLVEYSLSKKLKECIEYNKTETYEIKYKTKWDKEVWLRTHIKPELENEKVSGALIIIDDITEKKKLEEELQLLSYTDTLTGAYNRRYLIQKLEEEIDRTKRYGNEFSLILLDVDDFKKINDSYGHNIGDMVLKSIVKTIKERIREVDILARWGGEEFIIILPNTSVEKAVILSENLREKLSKINLPYVKKVTASFGVAGYIKGDTVDSLIKRADDLMYKSKSEGKNCINYQL